MMVVAGLVVFVFVVGVVGVVLRNRNVFGRDGRGWVEMESWSGEALEGIPVEEDVLTACLVVVVVVVVVVGDRECCSRGDRRGGILVAVVVVQHVIGGLW